MYINLFLSGRLMLFINSPTLYNSSLLFKNQVLHQPSTKMADTGRKDFSTSM